VVAGLDSCSKSPFNGYNPTSFLKELESILSSIQEMTGLEGEIVQCLSSQSKIS